MESCLKRVKLVPPPAGTKGTSHPEDSCVERLPLRLPDRKVSDDGGGGGADGDRGGSGEAILGKGDHFF